MNLPNDRKHSPYMEWAKLNAAAPFNLATSGLTNVTREEFPLRLADLEITHGGYGYPALLEKISEHTGAPVECIVTAAGTSMANHLVIAALLEPDDEVLLEQPTYGLLLDVLRYLGADLRRVERKFENDFALSLGEIDAALSRRTRLIVLTHPHNPSGALIPAETLRTIGEMAQRVGACVLVDEAYLEMLFEPLARLTSFSLGDNFIVTGSLTKTYGLSGLRCGWILAPAEIARRMWRLNDLFAATAPHAPERMSVVAFEHLENFRARARERLVTNRKLLDAFLDSRRDLPCFRPPAGTIVFPRLTNGDPETFFAFLREEYETSVVPGHFFEMPRHFRVGIGGETENVREGLARLGAALDAFPKEN